MMVANTIPPPKPAFKVAGNSSRRRMPAPTNKGPVLNPWEPWYAWRPKKVNGIWYWKQWIYRRYILSPAGGFYEYGDAFDFLKGS